MTTSQTISIIASVIVAAVIVVFTINENKTIVVRKPGDETDKRIIEEQQTFTLQEIINEITQ